MLIVDSTRIAFPCYLLDKTTDCTCMVFKQFVAEINDIGKIKCIRIDNGTELVNEQFTTPLRQHGVCRELDGVDSPKFNEAVESRIDMTTEGNYAAFLEPPRLFKDKGIAFSVAALT